MIKRLLKCVREYKKVSILCMLMTLAEVGMEVVIPYIMSYLIDDGLSAGNMGNIAKYGAILVVCTAMSLGFGVLNAFLGAKASVGFATNMRKDMYHIIQRFSFANIDHFSTSSIITRLTTDVTRVQMSYQMALRMALRMPLMLIFSMVMTFMISWKLAVIYLIVIPFLVGGLAFLSMKVNPIFRKVFRIFDTLNNNVQEDLHGIRVVKSFVREDYEREKFNKTSGEIFDGFTKAERLMAWNSPLMQGTMYITMLAISYIGAHMIVGQERVTVSLMGTVFTTGLLNSAFSYTGQVLMSCMGLSMIFVMIVMSRESMVRIVDILKEEPTITNPEAPVTEVKDGSIRFENVSFSYSDKAERNALQDVDLTIPSGATVGIIGGTGSSKSTLVQLLPRLYDVTSGCVKIGGVDVRQYDLKTLRDAVSVVLQKNLLFGGTIKDNLRWGNNSATDEEMIHACKLAQADGFIREFPEGYDTYITQGGTNVSGGQRQRLCIARALLKSPKVLILDDSTSAVDTATDAMIRKAFREEIPNVTKLIIAQRISSVQDADMIIVMDDGKVNGSGTHDELMKTNAIYREVYLSQQKGGNENE